MRKEYKERCTEAVKLYYENFGSGRTLSSWAREYGVNPMDAHGFVIRHEGIGMPENKRDARRYLKRLNQFAS